ncbi:hypothetical protein KCP75_24235 [Salmonella enterica subsp. enterica]|nr:hypothetical protein KCP75_24235 [Salmonella enterica subsp. enterica]
MAPRIIGLMVVGAMTASMIDITIPITFGTGEAKPMFRTLLTTSCLVCCR